MAKKPIRIAQMMTDMNYGGVEMVVMNYYKYIDKSEVQFDFFVFDGSLIPQKKEIESMGGKVYVVPKYTHPLEYEKEIQRIMKKEKYLVVHSHMNTLSAFSLYGAKRIGIPNRILHNHSTSGKGEFKKNIAKYILKPFAKYYSTCYCACSKIAGNWMYGNKTEYKIFNNAIDLDKFAYDEKKRTEIRNELNIKNAKVIGHIGRFCYQKNHDLLLEIFSKVLQIRQDCILLLIGEGELEQKIKNKAKIMGIEKKIIFLGGRTDAYKYYQAMDLFLLPSRYEGLPVVGIEAQACSLPCVFSKSITEEAKILASTVFVDDNIDEYVDAVICGLAGRRRDTHDEMRKAGYDIKLESKKLLDFYKEMVK